MKNSKCGITGVATRKVSNVTNRKHSGFDTIAEWHKEKSKSSVSHAFKDADYATGLWRCETEWDRTKEYAKWIVMWAFLFFALYSLACWFEGLVP